MADEHRILAYIVDRIGELYVVEGFDTDPNEMVSAILSPGEIDGTPNDEGFIRLVYRGCELVEAKALDVMET